MLSPMKDWQPLFDGSKKKVITEILDSIRSKIISEYNDCEYVGLYNGQLGQLIFLTTCSRQARIIDDYIEVLIQRINSNDKLNGSLYSGLSGIGIGLEMLCSGLNGTAFDTDFFVNLYEYVKKFIYKDIQKSNYDLLHGYVGECFSLAISKYTANPDILEKCIENLENIAFENEHGYGWINSIDFWKFYPEGVKTEQEIPDCCNLGIAHGSPGIILVLLEIQKKFPEIKLEPLINKALTFLLSQESESDKKEHNSYFSAYSGEKGKTNRGPSLAWCYSDLGISLALFKVSTVTGKSYYYKKAIHLAKSCAERTIENTNIRTSGLCHGVAGIAYMFNKIYQRTGDHQFKETSIYWFNYLINNCLRIDSNGTIQFNNVSFEGMLYNADNSLLEGNSGIGLALTSAISAQSPAWDKILLI